MTLEQSFVCALVAGVLFFALTPGVLLTLPPEDGCDVFIQLGKNHGGCATGWGPAIVHSVVFAFVVFLICFFYGRKK